MDDCQGGAKGSGCALASFPSPCPSNKKQHFEELFAVCQGLFDEIKKNRSLLKNKKIKKEMQILGRALEERKDDIDKIKGKMINPSDPDASWGAKSETKNFITNFTLF